MDTPKIMLISDYIEEIDKMKTQQKEFIDYLENEKDRLARECSQIYEDSLGKTRLVNEDIFNELDTILSKYIEIIEVKMNKEELFENISFLDEKDAFEKLDKNKELRDWFLVELNVYLQRSENIVANPKDRRQLRCYKNAVTSLQVENQELKNQQKEFIDYMNKTIEELESDNVDDEEMKGYLIQRIDTFKEILAKYIEINNRR